MHRMFGGELKARQERLQKEHRLRADEAKRKAERRKAVTERQRQRQLQLEEEQRNRRLAEEQAAEQARLATEALIVANKGVFHEAWLLALSADEESMRGKGIRRAADKVNHPR